MTQANPAALDAGAVLAKAALRAAERLGLSRSTLARVIGVSAASLSRVASGRRGLEPSTKEGELALLLVRVYRSLDALVGGDEAAARAWLAAEHRHLGGVPAERLTSVEGLMRVAEYLDAMRGRL